MGLFFLCCCESWLHLPAEERRLQFRHLFSSNKWNAQLNEGLGKLFKGVAEAVIQFIFRNRINHRGLIGSWLDSRPQTCCDSLGSLRSGSYVGFLLNISEPFLLQRRRRGSEALHLFSGNCFPCVWQLLGKSTFSARSSWALFRNYEVFKT